MTIRQFLQNNPNFFNDIKTMYIDIVNYAVEKVDAKMLDCVISYLEKIWITNYYNYSLIVTEQDFLSYIQTDLFEAIPNIIASLKQHIILSQEIYNKQEDYFILNSSEQSASIGYQGFNAEGNFQNNKVNQSTKNDSLINFLYVFNNEFKPIFRKITSELMKYLAVIYEI